MNGRFELFQRKLDGSNFGRSVNFKVPPKVRNHCVNLRGILNESYLFAFEGRDGEGCSSFEGSRSRDCSQLEQSERMEKGNGFRFPSKWIERIALLLLK
ncbi:MAG: hypothetical protein ACTS6A_02650 [Candidatus Hodgkinia cicadicola]